MFDAVPSRPRSLPPIVIALAGCVSLAVAMGIGRFAFTPVLPQMLAEGAVDIAGGSFLATMNYIGYLAGAVACMFLPAILKTLRLPEPAPSGAVRAGLAATAVLTLAMAADLPWVWPAFRFLSGIASAYAFVFTSGWCLRRLAEMGAPALGGVIYAGPGAGIAVSGLLVYQLRGTGGDAAASWTGLAILAVMLTALIWPVLREAPPEVAMPILPHRAPVARSAAAPPPAGDPWTAEQILFALGYGSAGFGYIITATFLPVIARESLSDARVIEFFWPAFGIAVVCGALLTGRVPARIDRRLLLIACQVVQAAGVLTTLVLPSVAGFTLGSVLVGLPFTAITLFALQEARRLRPIAPTSFMAMLTATYGVGQIAGPPFVAAVLARSATHAEGFAISLGTAAATLLCGAAVYGVLRAAYPDRATRR